MEPGADDKEMITNLGERTRALNTRTDKMQTWSINPNSSKYLGQERIYGCFLGHSFQQSHARLIWAKAGFRRERGPVK